MWDKGGNAGCWDAAYRLYVLMVHARCLSTCCMPPCLILGNLGLRLAAAPTTMEGLGPGSRPVRLTNNG